jgi:EAL domain-containing protein (putative c-di-GMP-specific phosphodiesterase class I)
VLSELLVSNGYLAIVLIDLSEVSKVAQESQLYDRLMDLLGREIVRLQGAELRPGDILTLSEKAGDAILVFLSPPNDKHLTPETVGQQADRIQASLNHRLSSASLPSGRGASRITTGFSVVIHNPLIQVPRLVQRGINEARDVANLNRLNREARDKQRLLQIILEEDIRPVYQPIVELGSRSIHGFEALTRGPRGTELESPLALFDMANKTDLLFEIDQVCRRKAVIRAQKLTSPYKLFINTLPFSIRDPHFRGRFLLDLLEGSELIPQRIVLEVTENLAIEDYNSYLAEMKYFSDMGFLTAIDDVGAGYSGLKKVEQLQPDYLKLDMHMVRHIDQSTVKQDVMRAFCVMAGNIGAEVIAEGIETREELRTVQQLGVDYVQGYFLARPLDGFQTTLDVEF